MARHAYEITVLSPDLDQPGLHAILEGVRELGLDLVSIGRAPRSAAQRHQFQPKRKDAVERAVQGSLVKITSKHGIAVGVFDFKIGECLAAQLAQTTENSDLIAMRAHRSSRYCRFEGIGTICPPWHYPERGRSSMPKRY